MPRIIWWVIIIAVLAAGAYAATSERRAVLVTEDGTPSRSGLSFGSGGRVAGESAEGGEAIAGKAEAFVASFVPEAVRDFVADPGKALQSHVAGVEASVAEAVKNEIADLFNIATATPPAAPGTGQGADCK